ncbi:flavin reductase family protein [Acrocarpospora catenulata]|uniref:flavin reductase family protein n=1 Tax=Acrocarpospora catenulata TaxID=2836182 RepID=UPI001BDAB87E|nr:flavin reductase family protein [Acrocarpospora catenulata]
MSGELFRSVFRHHPAGVTVVTFDSPNGPVGFTATSVVSVSLEPPLLSFAIAQTSSSLDALSQADTALVHWLDAGQSHLATRFARSAGERFSDPRSWSPLPSGEPLLNGVSTWARCRLADRFAAGDHTIVIGLVVEANVNGAAENPLVYVDGRYHEVAPIIERSQLRSRRA